MAQNWPSNLPQAFLQDGYQEILPNVVLRTEMDAGPAKSRRRFTVQVTPIKGSMVLTTAQKGYLTTFYNTTTAGGSLSFTFPYNGSSVFRFVSPPVITPFAAIDWIVDFDLEQLP